MTVLAIGVIFLEVADHGLVACRIESFLRSGAQVGQLSDVAGQRVLQGGLLQVVSEVSDEALAVVELDEEGLRVDRGPFSVHNLLGFTDITWLADLVGTLLGLYFEFVLQVDAPDLIRGELELVIIINELDAVWHIVSANFSRVEDVHVL